MKCPVCSGKMRKIKDRISQDNIDFEAYECRSCGEEIMDMPQLKKLAARYRKLRTAKPVKFSKWGNSVAIRIPSEFVNDFKLGEGKEGLLIKEKDGLKITVA